MVSMSYAEKTYKNVMVQTATDPLELVRMLYDGAIENLEQVIHSIEKKDYQKKSYHINKFIMIIEELLTSLNFEQGGVIAENLRDLYIFILSEVPKADIKKDLDSFLKIKKILIELRSAWREIR